VDTDPTGRGAAAGGLQLTFEAVAEARPGERWRALFDRLWPAYERWFVAEGDAARPPFLDCEHALREQLPELVPIWERLCELAGGGDAQARFLSLYRPPRYITGCSQAVWSGEEPMLVRNYDYAPRLCEGVLLRTEWSGRPVVAMSDCLIGALDGMNAAGLCASLSFGGRRITGDGFGAPLLVRYVLETCDTAREALDVLRRVRTHMAYNIVVLDRSGDFATVFTGPDAPAVVRRVPVSTNHQGRVEWPRHARETESVERERHLYARLADARQTAEDLVAEFLKPPLRSTSYANGHGTLYTAVYRPERGSVEYLWPGARWAQGLRGFTEGRMTVRLT
jgi:predicted choloylglycine hydrolase